MVIHQPLDFQYYFINIFAGSPAIFLILTFWVIVALAAKFRMNGYVITMVSFLFIVMMSSYFHSWYVLMMILLGLVAVPIIMRYINRQ